MKWKRIDVGGHLNQLRGGRHRPGRGAPQQGGFVLLVVLSLLVVLALLASAMAASGSRAVAEAQQDLDRFEGELDMVSTRETVMFMLATQRMNLAGLAVGEGTATSFVNPDDDELSVLPTGNDVRMDGTPYAGIGNAMFAIQDDRGLLSINFTWPAIRAEFLASLGVTPEEVAEFEARRLDYQDPDSLHRLEGAEADHYRAAGRPGPANRALATPLELRRILGWDEALADMDDARLLGMLTTARGADINLNSAPAAALALLPGMTQQEAERMVALRQRVPFTSTWQAQQSFPIAEAMGEAIALFPKGSGNLILWDRRFGARTLAHWTLTSAGTEGSPWRIDYEVTLPRGIESDSTVAETPATALLASQDSTGE